jgi:hypothetical protein
MNILLNRAGGGILEKLIDQISGVINVGSELWMLLEKRMQTVPKQ